MEIFSDVPGHSLRKVADSRLYVGRSEQNLQKCLSYSGVRIDVQDGNPPKFIVRPLVAERVDGLWNQRELESFVI